MSNKEIKNILKDIQIDLKEIKDLLAENKKETQNYKITLDAVQHQNNTVCEVLAEHSGSLKAIISSFWKTPKFVKKFPIKSDESLLKWEDEIDDDNKEEMVKTVTTIMGEKGLMKGLPLIICPNVLLKYNLNGTHNKKGIKSFKKILDVLYLSYTSAAVNDNDPPSFEKELRHALRNLKNRHFKDICLKNKQEKTKQNVNNPNNDLTQLT